MSYSDVKTEVINTLGIFWVKVFANRQFVDAYTSSIAVHFNDLNTLTELIPDLKSLDDMSIKYVEEVRLLLFNEEDLRRDRYHYGDEGLLYGDGIKYGAQLGTEPGYSYPIDVDVIPNFLSVSPLGDERIYQLGVDYVIAKGRIIFVEDPLALPDLTKNSVAGETGEPVFQFILWSFKAEVDLKTIQSFFGSIAGITASQSTAIYKDAVSIAWGLRVDGASVANLNKLLSIGTGTSFVQEGGLVKAVFFEGDKVCVETDKDVYVADNTAQVLVEVGDNIVEGQRIFDTYVVYTGGEAIPVQDFEALLLDKGILGTSFFNSVILDNSQVPITLTQQQDWTTVTHKPGGGFYIYDQNGNRVGFLEDESKVLEYIDAIPVDIYTFPAQGFSQDVYDLMVQLNTKFEGQSFFDLLAAEYGVVPLEINPMLEMRKQIFGYNSFFIKIRAGFARFKLLGQLLSVFRKTLNAGSTFFLLIETAELQDEYDMANAVESATVFYNVEAAENGIIPVETAIATQVVV